MTHKHIMIDIETLGTTPGSAILSIGAVSFDPHTGAIGTRQKQFYTRIDPDSCLGEGLTIQMSTVKWWMTEVSYDARMEAFGLGGEPLREALCSLKNFYTMSCPEAKYTWCHGATFDVPLLQVAFDRCKIAAPWKFWDIRDTRTLYDLAGITATKPVGEHNALIDAIAQAKDVICAYAALRAGVAICQRSRI